MKFVIKFNLPHLFLALTILMTLLSIIENTSKSRRMPNPYGAHGLRHGEVCKKNHPDFKPKKCDTGLVCRTKPVASPKEIRKNGGVTVKSFAIVGQDHYCLKNNEQFGELEQVCHESGFIPKTCKEPLVCRRRDQEEGKRGTGYISYCLEKKTPAKHGEVCKRNHPGFKPKNCDTGLVCRTKPIAKTKEIRKNGVVTVKSFAIVGQDHYCLKNNEEFGEFEDDCRKSIPSYIPKLCAEPLVCRLRDQVGGMRGTGHTSYCLEKKTPAKPAKHGEVCKRNHPDFKPKNCEPGLVCAPKPVAKQNEKRKNGVVTYTMTMVSNPDHYCLNKNEIK